MNQLIDTVRVDQKSRPNQYGLKEIFFFFFLFETVVLFPLVIYPQMALLGHMVVLSLIFGETALLFFHSGCTNLHPDKMCTGLFFSTSSPTFFIFRPFSFSFIQLIVIGVSH